MKCYNSPCFSMYFLGFENIVIKKKKCTACFMFWCLPGSKIHTFLQVMQTFRIQHNQYKQVIKKTVGEQFLIPA